MKNLFLLLSLAFTSAAMAAPLSHERHDHASAPGANTVHTARGAALPVVEVWKSPFCGCCKGWVAHMEEAGFTVKVHETDDVASVKRKFGVPAGSESCHTSHVAGYALEGHVPADAVKKLLAEKPTTAGIGVPGMPMNSPGMGALNGQLKTLTFEGAVFSTN